MRRALLVVVLCLAFPAPAFAKVVACTGGTCKGTDQSDQITGSPQHDEIFGKGGDDTITANQSPVDGDKVYGGGGNDTINTNDVAGMLAICGQLGAQCLLASAFAQAGDYVNCGSGSKDVAHVDLHDSVSSTCEKIIRSP